VAARAICLLDYREGEDEPTKPASPDNDPHPAGRGAILHTDGARRDAVTIQLIQGDCLQVLKTLPDNSVQTVVTSPPYWGLRCYIKEGEPGKESELGLESTPEDYVAKMVAVFREVRRVMREDGVLWLNLGDSYAGSGKGQTANGRADPKQRKLDGMKIVVPDLPDGLKSKDLVGIPWRVAFALQADGWWLRQDIIWCLSGGTYLYVKSQKGVMPMMVRDMARLDPSTVKLWNGDKWTQLLGVSKSKRKGDELEIVLRSGERISCTPSHRFPTRRGFLDASELQVGDILCSVGLPDVDDPRDCALDEDAAWFAGLYIAEGSHAGDCIQISGHSKEKIRWERCNRIANKFGGSATLTTDGNTQSIRMYGKILNAILDELVSGTYSYDKCFATVVWRYSNKFIEAMVDGYLSGDGHWEEKNKRWRLGFTRNYNLERDLRTACARLGYHLILNFNTIPYNGKDVATFRGELRKERSLRKGLKSSNEVMAIRKARCRYVYDLGVADEPHVFALASGVLTHNSKPNPMPESVTDRCTKSHEYIFLLTKSARYYFDNEAIKEASVDPIGKDRGGSLSRGEISEPTGLVSGFNHGGNKPHISNGTRNRRDVWFIATQPFPGSHFAVMPEKLVEPCILAGSRPGDVVLDPFNGAGTVGVVAKRLGRSFVGIELNPEYIEMAANRIGKVEYQGVLL
jgi:DNA modification methylase